MNSAPKITVLKIQEIVYTLILVFFILTLLVCLFLMFSGKKQQDTNAGGTSGNLAQTDSSGTDSSEDRVSATGSYPAASSEAAVATDAVSSSDTASTSSATYIAGVYTVSLSLGDAAADVQVTVEADRIKAIELVNLTDAVAASYPLVSPALENLTSQILEKQKLDGITCSLQNRYTSQLLLNAISKALSLARCDD